MTYVKAISVSPVSWKNRRAASGSGGGACGNVVSYLDGGEDPSQGSSEQQEDGDGRELARVSVLEVCGSLDQLETQNRDV